MVKLRHLGLGDLQEVVFVAYVDGYLLMTFLINMTHYHCAMSPVTLVRALNDHNRKICQLKSLVTLMCRSMCCPTLGSDVTAPYFMEKGYYLRYY